MFPVCEAFRKEDRSVKTGWFFVDKARKNATLYKYFVVFGENN